VRTLDALPGDGKRPHMIIAQTVKGKGVKYMEQSRLWHLGHLAGPDAEATIQEILAYEHA
jgi:transketolase